MTGIIVTITICKKKSIMHPNNTQSRHKTHKTIPTVIKENKPSAMHYAHFKSKPTHQPEASDLVQLLRRGGIQKWKKGDRIRRGTD